MARECRRREAMRARSPSDGEGRGLPAGEASRPSVAPVHVLEVEPAHVAPGRGGGVRVVSAWKEDLLVLLPEEACRAGRWTRPLDAMAAVELARGVAQIP